MKVYVPLPKAKLLEIGTAPVYKSFNDCMSQAITGHMIASTSHATRTDYQRSRNSHRMYGSHLMTVVSHAIVIA